MNNEIMRKDMKEAMDADVQKWMTHKILWSQQKWI